jgi:hypothetical protein
MQFGLRYFGILGSNCVLIEPSGEGAAMDSTRSIGVASRFSVRNPLSTWD